VVRVKGGLGGLYRDDAVSTETRRDSGVGVWPVNKKRYAKYMCYVPDIGDVGVPADNTG
jgi:hypothetical protein